MLAELELTAEELALTSKYSFTKATLIASDASQDLANAYRPAVILSIIAALSVALFIPTVVFGDDIKGMIFKTAMVPAVGLVCFILLTGLYFFELRKHVTVDQLTIGGRVFHCHSVVELDNHEAEILDICKRFYLTLEKAKNWGGSEINPLPDGEPYYLTNPEYGAKNVGIDRAMHKAGTVTKKLMKPFMIDGEPAMDSHNPEERNSPKDNSDQRNSNTPRSSPKHPLFGLLGGADGAGWDDENASKPRQSTQGSTQNHSQSISPSSTDGVSSGSSEENKPHPFASKPPYDGSSGSSGL